TNQPESRTLMNFDSATELYTEYPEFLAGVLGVEKKSLTLTWESDDAVVSKLLKEAIGTLQLAHDIAAMRESGQHLADYSLTRMDIVRYRSSIDGAACTGLTTAIKSRRSSGTCAKASDGSARSATPAPSSTQP